MLISNWLKQTLKNAPKKLENQASMKILKIRIVLACNFLG
jgi:hypothetical protein